MKFQVKILSGEKVNVKKLMQIAESLGCDQLYFFSNVDSDGVSIIICNENNIQ